MTTFPLKTYHLLHIAPPEGRVIFVGLEHGKQARFQLDLDAKDQTALETGLDRYDISMLGRGRGIIARSYLTGLFGPSVRALGEWRFNLTYKLYRTAFREDDSVDLSDFARRTLRG